MKLPKIVYNPGTGAVTLNFTYPPVQKPGADELKAERTDTKSSSGLVQSICQYIEVFRTLQMDFVPMEDLPNWSAFFKHALTGKSFTYYPDATDAGTHDDWTLSDTDWNPAYAFRTVGKFKMKMRSVITL